MTRQQRFAPPHPHGRQVPQEGYAGAWSRFRQGLFDVMRRPFSRINHEGYEKATLYSNGELRYDREYRVESFGHPRDNFVSYQVQANLGAGNPTLSRMAARGNGRHRTNNGGLGGSSIANVMVQQGGGSIPPGRVGFALEHSYRYGTVRCQSRD
jgi:hypothetical protein